MRRTQRSFPWGYFKPGCHANLLQSIQIIMLLSRCLTDIRTRRPLCISSSTYLFSLFNICSPPRPRHQMELYTAQRPIRRRDYLSGIMSGLGSAYPRLYPVFWPAGGLPQRLIARCRVGTASRGSRGLNSHQGFRLSVAWGAHLGCSSSLRHTKYRD